MTDILIPKKNIIMDATTLSSLMSCARLHDLRFNHQLGSAKGRSNSLEIGSLIHKVLEVFYDHMIKGYPRTTAIGNALASGQLFVIGCPHCTDFIPPDDDPDARPQCKHDPNDYPGVHNTPEASEGFTVGWRFALETCEKYFDFYKNDSFIPLAAEEVKGEVIYEDDEIRVLWKAKFDLIIDTNQIGIVSMDHKTFKQRREKTTLSNQFMGQCLLLKARNVIVNKIGLQTTLKIDDRLTREVVSYSADRLDEWQNDIIPYYAYKYLQFNESDYWPPNYTHCDTMYGPCAFKQVCEANRNMRADVLRNDYVKLPLWDPQNRSDE